MEIRPHLSLKEIKSKLLSNRAANIAGRTILVLCALPAALLVDANRPVSAVQGFGEPPAPYPQCGTGPGTAIESGPIESSHTVFVTPQFDRSGNLVYGTQDLGIIAGQCGNTFMAPDDLISPVDDENQGQPVVVGTIDGASFAWSRRYTQCGGALGPMVFRSNHTLRVDEFVNPELRRIYAVHNLGPLPGQCGNPEN